MNYKQISNPKKNGLVYKLKKKEDFPSLKHFPPLLLTFSGFLLIYFFLKYKHFFSFHSMKKLFIFIQIF